MIADYPFLANLATGVDRVIPQEGDAQVVIPSVVSPVIPPLYAHDVSNLSTDRCTTSKLVENNQTKINVPAVTENVVVLPKGLYTLQFNFCVRSNFNPVALNEGVKLSLVYQGFTIHLAALLMLSGVTVIEGERYLLLTSDATVVLEFSATNAIATNSYSSSLGLNVVRHI